MVFNIFVSYSHMSEPLMFLNVFFVVPHYILKTINMPQATSKFPCHKQSEPPRHPRDLHQGFAERNNISDLSHAIVSFCACKASFLEPFQWREKQARRQTLAGAYGIGPACSKNELGHQTCVLCLLSAHFAYPRAAHAAEPQALSSRQA
jgi:hypothetical protein